MIVSLKGVVTYHGVGFVIIENAGVGYRVIVPEDQAHALAGEVFLYTHEVVREDSRELFGFLSVEALELFWKLTSVSGVGPKSAQKIVFAAPVDRVKERVMASDISFLTNVPGIGKKTAQKIILELKGALAQEPEVPACDPDAVDALVGLGYTKRQAEQVLIGLPEQTTEERIRSALKVLGR
ncbi:Holliday junction branch migration protein RuvA [Candidatus Uhrbacteria bacterium]|nr:Holliday junction branch migration protein RuvA [Candidatus Uhrbacteria bacterium]